MAATVVSLTRDVRDARLVHLVYLVGLVCLVDHQVRASKDGDARQATRGLNSTLYPHSARRLVWSLLRASDEHVVYNAPAKLARALFRDGG